MNQQTQFSFRPPGTSGRKSPASLPFGKATGVSAYKRKPGFPANVPRKPSQAALGRLAEQRLARARKAGAQFSRALGPSRAGQLAAAIAPALGHPLLFLGMVPPISAPTTGVPEGYNKVWMLPNGNLTGYGRAIYGTTTSGVANGGAAWPLDVWELSGISTIQQFAEPEMFFTLPRYRWTREIQPGVSPSYIPQPKSWPKPEPEYVPQPRVRPRPGRRLSPRVGTVRSISAVGNNVTARGYNLNGRPPPNVREKKARLRGIVGVIWAGISGFTEFLDLVDALYSGSDGRKAIGRGAFGGTGRSGKESPFKFGVEPSYQEKIEYLFFDGGMSTVDMSEFGEAFLENQFEDKVFGFYGRLAGRGSRDLNLTVGIQTGPTL